MTIPGEGLFLTFYENVSDNVGALEGLQGPGRGCPGFPMGLSVWSFDWETGGSELLLELRVQRAPHRFNSWGNLEPGFLSDSF